MSISLKRDKPFENIPSIKAKALRINLNEYIYGTFAEIGAGQEVARHFFRSGGASGTQHTRARRESSGQLDWADRAQSQRCIQLSRARGDACGVELL